MAEAETNLGVMTTETRSAGPTGRSIALHGLAAALMFISPLVVFVPAAIISSGLRNGRRGLWFSTLLAAGLLAILFSAAESRAAYTPVARMLFEVGVPSAVGLELILRGLMFGPVLLAVLAASFGGFALVEVVMRGFASFSPYRGVIENFRAASQAQVEAYRTAGVPADAISMMERVTETIATSYMPAVLVIVAALMFALSFVMLPRLKSGRALLPRFLFRNFSLPDALLFGFVLGGIAPLLKGIPRTLGFNVLAVAVVLFMLQGLAVFRYHQTRLRLGILGTVLAILTLLLLTPYGVTPFGLFLIGLFDPFFDFRHFNRKEAPNESDSD